MAQNRNEELDWQQQVEFDKLTEAQKNADRFSPEQTIYIAGEYGKDWLLRAISKQTRERWADRSGVRDNARKIFDKALNALAASCAPKFAALKPKSEFFAFHGKAEEEALKRQLDNLANLKIHKIGLLYDKWRQDNNDGPYQIGYIWVRDISDDHPYCRLYKFRLTRNYIGNGKYGDECYASILENDIVTGCP